MRDVLVQGGREFVWTLSDAAATAWRSGRGTVGTLDVLVELASRLPSLNRLLGQRVGKLKEAAGVSGAEQPPDGELPVAPSAIEQEAQAVLREATWVARRHLRKEVTDTAPRWSPASHAAVRDALALAQAHRLRHAHGMHLFQALLEASAGRAAQTLADLGIGLKEVARRMPVDSSVVEEGTPMADAALSLSAVGVLDSGGALSRRLRVTAGRLVLRSRAGVVLPFVEQEAIRQTVRRGAVEVDSVASLAAVLALDEQLTAVGRTLAPPWAAANAGGEVLRVKGIDVSTVLSRAGALPASSTPDRAYRWRSLRGDPPFGRDAASVSARAHDLADGSDVGTSHLVLAMLAVDDCAAHRLLRGLLNLRDVREEVTARLGCPRAS